ncbi:MAG: PQQ-dependent sugar dehydrogenase [Candidatus Hydrogenedentales bacterium]
MVYCTRVRYVARLACVGALAAFCLLLPSCPLVGLPKLALVEVASGLDLPDYVCSAPGDASRLFVVERNTALIRIVKDGVLLPAPFLDLSAKVDTGGYEKGLCGLVFHPGYATNGYFYVKYSAPNLVNTVERYSVSVDPDVADPESDKIILSYQQFNDVHFGGMLAFGLDGYLYVGAGDGAFYDGVNHRAQDLGLFNGKMLRIDVDNGDPYAVPSDNPFVDTPGALGEIWAYGLRNPWRFSFDRLTGDLYIGDVGLGSREEVNFQPHWSPGGQNYGWEVAEGAACLGGSGNCGANPGFTPPIYDVAHPTVDAITGGYVYRCSAIPALRGTYFFADFVSGRIWSFRYRNGRVTELVERTDEFAPPGGQLDNVVSFGEDANGELYVVDYSGEVYRIVRAQ